MVKVKLVAGLADIGKSLKYYRVERLKMQQISPKRICDVDRKEAGRHNPPQAVTHVFRPVSGIA